MFFLFIPLIFKRLSRLNIAETDIFLIISVPNLSFYPTNLTIWVTDNQSKIDERLYFSEI